MSELKVAPGRREEEGLGPPSCRRGISLRAVLLGLILLPFNTYYIIQLEIIRYQSWPTILSLFMNSLFVLFVLVIINLGLRRRFPRFAFSPAELLTIYLILNIGTLLAGTDFMQVLISMMGHATYFASDENKWGSLFLAELPDWLVVKDKKALEGFYIGHSTLFRAEHLRSWLMPMLCWGGFIMLLFWVMLCMNVLLRKQWTDRERLTFPIVQMPLALATTPGLLRNKMLWMGVGLSSLAAIFNELNVLFPGFPALPVKTLTIPQPPTRPWAAVGQIPIFFYPFVIGIAMLMPMELAFSCWFFFWFHKMEAVISQASGWDVLPEFPFLLQQSAGAFIGICIFALFNERRYLAAVFRRALGLASELDDSGEPLRYRWAVLGLAGGLAAIAFFSWRTGVSLELLAIFFGLYLAMAIGLTRLRAELGAPVHDLPFVGPERFITDTVGTFRFSRHDLSIISLYYWFNRSYGSHPMPVQLEGFRMGERTGMNSRHLVLVMLAAALVGTAACFLVMTELMYRLGANSGQVLGDVVPYFGSEPYNRLESWLTVGQSPRPLRLGAGIFGFVFAFILLGIRLRVTNWPFHPLGFALAGSWYMTNALWASIFIGWLAKALLMRYGGQRAYLLFLPFFLGLILGDCVWGSIWLIIGVAFKTRTYSVWF